MTESAKAAMCVKMNDLKKRRRMGRIEPNTMTLQKRKPAIPQA